MTITVLRNVLPSVRALKKEVGTDSEGGGERERERERERVIEREKGERRAERHRDWGIGLL